MPADATIVSLRSDRAEAPAARRDCPREQPERPPRENPQQPPREQPPREQPERLIESPRSPKRRRSLRTSAGCAGRHLRCFRWR